MRQERRRGSHRQRKDQRRHWMVFERLGPVPVERGVPGARGTADRARPSRNLKKRAAQQILQERLRETGDFELPGVAQIARHQPPQEPAPQTLPIHLRKRRPRTARP